MLQRRKSGNGHFSGSDNKRNKLIFCGRGGNLQNLQQKPQPLLPLQQLQHKTHRDRWLWRFCLMWFGICARRQETWAWCSSPALPPLLVRRDREHEGAPWGKHIHLNFNLLMVIGLIHSVNWTYHPRFHWHFLMCRKWSVIAPCLLQLLHLLMNYAHLGATTQHPDKTFIANKQMKWVGVKSLPWWLGWQSSPECK